MPDEKAPSHSQGTVTRQTSKNLVRLHGNGACFPLSFSPIAAGLKNLSPKVGRTGVFHQTFLLLNSFDTYPAGPPNILLQDGANPGPNKCAVLMDLKRTKQILKPNVSIPSIEVILYLPC